MFRVVIALVQTGSRLASGDCGTNASVFTVPPIAGAARTLAAPAKKPRRGIVVFPPLAPVSSPFAVNGGSPCHQSTAGPSWVRFFVMARPDPQLSGSESAREAI